MTFLRTVRLPILIALLFTAQTVLAQFEPLAPIPGVTTGGEGIGLVGYIQRFFYLAIFIGGILAVIRITMAGIKYMFTDVVSSKSEARNDILGALMGIGILLISVLVLTRINPDLLNLDVLRNAEPVALKEGQRKTDRVIKPESKECETLTECERYRDEVLSGPYKEDGSGGCPEGFTAKAEDPWGFVAGRAWCDNTTQVLNDPYPLVDSDSDLYDEWEDKKRKEKIDHINTVAADMNKRVEECDAIPGFSGALSIVRDSSLPWYFGVYSFVSITVDADIDEASDESLNAAKDVYFEFTCKFIG